MKISFKKKAISLLFCLMFLGSIAFSGCQNLKEDLKGKCQVVFDYVGTQRIHCYEIKELTTFNQNIENADKFFDDGIIYSVTIYGDYGSEMTLNEFFLGKLNGETVLYRVVRSTNMHNESVLNLYKCDLNSD